jgi:nicotinamidase-related amidase
MTPALIVVDMIKDNIETEKHLGIAQEAKSILPNLCFFINYFREKGFPVVYANDSFLKNDFIFSGKMKEHAVRGTIGTQVIDILSPKPDDIIINKLRFSAFYKTDLDQILRRLGVDTVFVVGISTMWCVFLTATDALSNDFYTIIVEDLAACHKKEIHDKFVDLYKNFPLFPLFRFLTSQESMAMINKGKNAYTPG